MKDSHPARGKIDLSWHKLAGVYRVPTKRSLRYAIRKPRDEAYRQLWRLVGGAVGDAFATHPEYLTPLGQRKAAEAVIKRVTGTLFGYATQVAQGRSVSKPGEAQAEKAAAEVTDAPSDRARSWQRLIYEAAAWVQAVRTRTWAGAVTTSARNSSADNALEQLSHVRHSERGADGND